MSIGKNVGHERLVVKELLELRGSACQDGMDRLVSLNAETLKRHNK